ncbi:helix-turn-helix domain-containing protein [Micromonospora wenchangensis]|uniref:helix-turn-helix domain-containing protein n=1 Tax=Micromonospora wenchangensis TaxID=1185415 RepID=UPI003D747F11
MTPSDPRPLGPLITQLRLARGWSQRRLADELCAAAGTATLTRHEVSRWERSVRVPGDRWRRQLAVVLDAPIGPPARRAAPHPARRAGKAAPGPTGRAARGRAERRPQGPVRHRSDGGPARCRAPPASRPAGRPDRPAGPGRGADRGDAPRRW